MATLTLQDRGAEGDGNMDSTAAINDAIPDVGTSDTVLIPSTAGHHLVSVGNRGVVEIIGVDSSVVCEVSSQ